MPILYFSTILTSALMLSLLALVFLENEFKLRRKMPLYKKSFRLLAGAAISATIITSIVGLSISPEKTNNLAAKTELRSR